MNHAACSMGRVIFLAILAALCVLPVGEASGRLPASQCRGSHAPLYDIYPMVGADEVSVYYLDTSSCTYYIDGNKAYPSCLVYATAGGAAPDGGPGKLIEHVITFRTYKNHDGQRVIGLESEMVRGKDISASARKYDEGFLVHLFWRVARESGLADSLD